MFRNSDAMFVGMMGTVYIGGLVGLCFVVYKCWAWFSACAEVYKTNPKDKDIRSSYIASLVFAIILSIMFLGIAVSIFCGGFRDTVMTLMPN